MARTGRLFLAALFLLVMFPVQLPGEELETVAWKGRSLGIVRDPVTRLPLIIRGLREPLLKVSTGFPADRRQAAASGYELAAFLESLLPISPGQIRFKSAEVIEGSWFVSFWQMKKNYIVYGSSLGYSIDRGGRIQSVGALLYPGISVPERLVISRTRALQKAQSAVKDFRRKRYRLVAENVLIFPDRGSRPIRYYLAYAFNFFPPEKDRHPGTVEAGVGFFIDTQTGAVLDRQTLFKPLGCCMPEKGAPADPEKEYKSQIGQ